MCTSVLVLLLLAKASRCRRTPCCNTGPCIQVRNFVHGPTWHISLHGDLGQLAALPYDTPFRAKADHQPVPPTPRKFAASRAGPNHPLSQVRVKEHNQEHLPSCHVSSYVGRQPAPLALLRSTAGRVASEAVPSAAPLDRWSSAASRAQVVPSPSMYQGLAQDRASSGRSLARHARLHVGTAPAPARLPGTTGRSAVGSHRGMGLSSTPLSEHVARVGTITNR